MTPPPGRPARLWWLAPLLAAVLLAGALAGPRLERALGDRLPAAWRSEAPLATPLEVAGVSTRIETTRADIAAISDRVAALEARPAGPRPAAALNDAPLAGMAPADAPPGLARRLDAIEARLAAAEEASAGLGRRVDQLAGRSAEAARSSAADANRAYDLLLVEAVRRAVARGEGLARLMPTVRETFARDEAAAVAALNALALAPIDPARLSQGVARVRAGLARPPPSNAILVRARAALGSWARLRSPEERARTSALDLAQRRFALADVAGGAAALARARQPAAAPVLAGARRLLAAEAALARIEAAALEAPGP